MASSPSNAVLLASAARAANYARLRAWFDECVDMPEGERLGWIERNVPNDGLRLELALMLASDAGGTDLFGADPLQKLGDYLGADAAVALDLAGTRCGAFRLVRVLGSGGQGTVYLGERDDGDFVQIAAVKLLRQVLLDATDLRRFRRERDILARFEHAGVARLIDAGISASGLPFLVMEYVDGEPIDLWCAQQGIGMSQRLQLFAELCEVIAAAHRQLIVHRDLKPSNVLVSTEGRIKVLDFGIACLLDENGDASTHAQMLTPGYGAPEQRTGEPVTPASDVFALGAMLRELIAEQSPPRRSGETWPPWPTRAPEELRWIFERCCAADSSERYRDAAELHEDIENFRLRRPVRAHPPSGWYRARKFVARHRGGVTLSALLLLTTIIGFGTTLWQTRVARQESARATAEAQRAKSTTDFLLGVFKAAQDGLPEDAKPTPDVLVQAAAAKLELDTSLPATTRADFLATLGHVARHSNDPQAALPLFERAIALSKNAPDSRDRLYVEVMRAMTLSRVGRAAEAEAALRPRMDALRDETDYVAVNGLWTYADALGELGRLDDYLKGMEEARVMAAAVHGPDAEETLVLDASYAIALYSVGRHQEAAATYESMIARWRAAGLPKQRDYAISLANLGAMKHQLGDLIAAEDLLREAVTMERAIHKKAHPNTAILTQMFGQVLTSRGKTDEAEPLLVAAHADLLALYGPTHNQTLSGVNALGELELERLQYDAAAIRLRTALETCDGIEDGSSASECISIRTSLADALLHTGHADDAIAVAARATQQRRELGGEDSSDIAPSMQVEAEALLERGDAAQALSLLDAAAALYSKGGIAQNLNLVNLHVVRARALLALGRADDALAALDRAAPMLAAMAPHNPARNLRLLAARATALAALARAGEARAAATEALKLQAARAVLAAGEWEQLQALTR